ncbi:amidohydrolase family protein [Teredinibacter waterburyi]|uniref:amidohydrolase family protein n=1 Tax=Teredinibacter waterburyi TaxID=1500538 RepID=UPI00165FAB4E|nr:amidohydrolase family protein [Teredinibacter waterburyi]
MIRKKIMCSLGLLLTIATIVSSTLIFSGCNYTKKLSPQNSKNHYIVAGVNLIDVVNQKIIPKQSIEVKQGKIVRIFQHDKKSLVANNVHTINAKGKYLLPGLWDMHTVTSMLSPELDYPLYIANGVTSIRSIIACPNENKTSLYPCFQHKQQWNQEVLKQEMVGPIIRGSGTFPVNGEDHSHPDSPDFHATKTSEDVQKLVNYYANINEGMRPFFIKSYNWIQPEAYFEMASEAKKQGIEIGGHMPRKVGLMKAIDAGQRSFAHARLFLFDCSKYAAELREGKHWDKPLADLYRLLIDSFDEKNCAEKYRYLAEHDVYLSPTLLTRRNDYLAVAEQESDVEGLEYTHYIIRLAWSEDIAGLTDRGRSDAPIFKEFYELAAKTIVDAHRHGVKVMVGTDANDVYVVPGFSLHEEMKALNNAGMSAFDILTAATLVPAQYFKMDKHLGSIEEGKDAEFILLHDNPVSNIAHAKNINMVFQGETIYDEKEIDELKSHVKESSGSHRILFYVLSMWLKNPAGF